MICRIRGHKPRDYQNDSGEATVICDRCGLDIKDWKRPLMGARTRATLFTCAGVGVGVYMAMDVTATGRGDAILAGFVATVAAICAQFGTDRMAAGK